MNRYYEVVSVTRSPFTSFLLLCVEQENLFLLSLFTTLSHFFNLSKKYDFYTHHGKKETDF